MEVTRRFLVLVYLLTDLDILVIRLELVLVWWGLIWFGYGCRMLLRRLGNFSCGQREQSIDIGNLNVYCEVSFLESTFAEIKSFKFHKNISYDDLF